MRTEYRDRTDADNCVELVTDRDPQQGTTRKRCGRLVVGLRRLGYGENADTVAGDDQYSADNRLCYAHDPRICRDGGCYKFKAKGRDLCGPHYALLVKAQNKVDRQHELRERRIAEGREYVAKYAVSWQLVCPLEGTEIGVYDAEKVDRLRKDGRGAVACPKCGNRFAV